MDKQYAYSVMQVKVMEGDDGKRRFTGIATTPSVDRTGDIVEPKGAEFTLPIPLCWMHNTDDPIGWVTSAKVTDKGIEIEGEVASVKEPQNLKDRLDDAWAKIKVKLVRGLSIGFKPLEYSRIGETYSYRYIKWLWLELSPVVVPANQDCSILAIKSIDEATRKSAKVIRLVDSPGVPGPSKVAKLGDVSILKGTTVKTIAEQIAAFDARRRVAVEAKSTLIQTSLDEGRTLEAAEEDENTNLENEIVGIDKHLSLLRKHEQFLVANSKAVLPATGVDAGAGNAGGGSSVDLGKRQIYGVKRNLPPGTAYTRFAMAMACGKGNLMQAEQIVMNQIRKGVWDTTPELEVIMKAAVAAGTTSDTTWAGPLVQYQDMASEFIELLRPQMILGKLTKLRKVPFNIRIPRQTGGSTGTFVGEGAPTPVRALAFDNITMPWAKASTIVVLTVELARLSEPSAEALVKQDLMDGVSQYLDKRLIDPVYAGVANVSPASLSYGVTGRQASGSSIAAIDDDVEYVMTQFANNELSLESGVWIMSPGMALKLSLMRTNQDTKAFPDINIKGGTWYGLPVIVSNNVVASASPGESQIFLVDQAEVLLADDGQMTIDVSTEASVQMSDTPSAGAQSLVSLWQNGLLGIMVHRWIYWTKRRAQALQFIEAAQRYGS